MQPCVLERSSIGRVRHEAQAHGSQSAVELRLTRVSGGRHAAASRVVASVAMVPSAPAPAVSEQKPVGSVVPAPSLGLATDATPVGDVSVLDRLQSGKVTLINSPQELVEVVNEHKDKVVVLKCKAKSCRPCMAFRRPYVHLAEESPDVVFLEILGDASVENRRLMMDFNVKATPTFRIYKANKCVDKVVGINKEKLSNAVHSARNGFSLVEA